LFHQFRKLFSSNKNIYIDEALYTAHVTRHASEMIHKAKKQIKNKVPQDQNGFLNRVQIVKGVLGESNKRSHYKQKQALSVPLQT